MSLKNTPRRRVLAAAAAVVVVGVALTARGAEFAVGAPHPPPGPGPFPDSVIQKQPVRGAARFRTGRRCVVHAPNNSNATAKLRAAIAACGDRREGGTVLIPRGLVLYTSSLWLRSNLTLRIEFVLMSTGEAPPLVYTHRGHQANNQGGLRVAHAGLLNGGRWLGDRWSHLENVVIEGGGRIDGNARPTSQYDDDHAMRPVLLDLLWVKGLTIRDVSLRRPAFHTVRLVFCDGVRVTNVSIYARGGNTDGLDPDSSWNVYIADSVFDTGDDCLAIKTSCCNISTRNVLAERNEFRAGHGVSIGSGTGGGIRDVVIRDSTVSGTRVAVRIKSARGHGGSVRRVTYSNISGTALKAVELTLMYGRDPEKHLPMAATPAISDISIERLAVTTQSGKAAYVACHGLPESPIADIRFDRVSVIGGREQTCTYCSIDGPGLSRACRGEASPVAFLGLVVAAVLVAAIVLRRPRVLGAEDEVGLLQSARRRRRETRRSLAS